MSKKAKLSQLNRELSSPNNKKTKTATGVNPARGERGFFQKVTITLSPDMHADLKMLGIKRKRKGMRDTDVSSLIREALASFLEAEEE